MDLLRETKKSTLYVWVILLSVALVAAQGVTLHVHAIDHDHLQFHNHLHNHENLLDQATSTEPARLSVAHLSADLSHSHHHDRVIYENDACPDGLLTKVSIKLLFTALLFALFVWVLMSVCRHTYIHRSLENIPFLIPFHFIPPSRAPPLI